MFTHGGHRRWTLKQTIIIDGAKRTKPDIWYNSHIAKQNLLHIYPVYCSSFAVFLASFQCLLQQTFELLNKKKIQ